MADVRSCAIVIASALACAACPRAPAVADAGVADAGAVAVVVDAGPASSDVKIASFAGTVEVRRQGSEEWAPVAQGDVLKQNDEIRTGADGKAELDAAGNVVELSSGTDMKVAELTEGLTKYLLGAGLVAAESRPDANRPGAEKKLQVAVAGSDVTVSATDGRFRMSSNGQGTVAVGAQDGKVSVSAAGKEVVLQQGERTLVAPGQAPTDPAPFAKSLMLKVYWPSERETNKKRVTVSGRTESGALVFAMGKPIPVGTDGTFSATLSLAEGQNLLDARAVDVSGNVAKSGGPRVLLDTTGAASRFKTDDLWKKKSTK